MMATQRHAYRCRTEVFSCSLLHAAKRVTRGNRCVFLRFLYDEAGEAIREKNNEFLVPAAGQYRA